MKTFLIVDDNAEMRQLIKTILKKMSDAVFECEDGDEVLAAFAAHLPDWVLMDVEMKRMDGLDATKQILASFPNAQILIVTQHDDRQLREAARAAGARNYLLKENLMDLRRILV